jgi:VCBS repeat-containing protein
MNNHQVTAPLDTGTTYYWRVTPTNGCGVGTVSAVFDFTTRSLEYCSSPDLAINGGPHTDDIVIADLGLLSDVDIELNLTHTWIGDLDVSLEHVDSSTSVLLVDEPGDPLYGANGCNDNDLVNFLLNDGSSNGAHDNACPNTDSTPAYPASSDWDPIAALAAFNGEDLDGTWRLSVTDTFPADDDGTLVRWCIVPGVAPEAVEDDYMTDVDVTLTVTAPGVLSNDSDLNGDPLTAVLDTDVSDGTLTLNADGSFTYVPDAGFYGTDSFTYHANDGTTDSNTVTVTIEVIQDEFKIYMPAIFKP